MAWDRTSFLTTPRPGQNPGCDWDGRRAFGSGRTQHKK
jgi:hypothetical protein